MPVVSNKGGHNGRPLPRIGGVPILGQPTPSGGIEALAALRKAFDEGIAYGHAEATRQSMLVVAALLHSAGGSITIPKATLIEVGAGWSITATEDAAGETVTCAVHAPEVVMESEVSE